MNKKIGIILGVALLTFLVIGASQNSLHTVTKMTTGNM